MITIEKLNEYGADTKDGLARCLGMEEFYLKLVNTMIADENFGKLDAAIEDGDVKKAFEAAHALKGVLANLSITPLYEPMSEITELLRAKEAVDYQPLVDAIMLKWDEFLAL